MAMKEQNIGQQSSNLSTMVQSRQRYKKEETNKYDRSAGWKSQQNSEKDKCHPDEQCCISIKSHLNWKKEVLSVNSGVFLLAQL